MDFDELVMIINRFVQANIISEWQAGYITALSEYSISCSTEKLIGFIYSYLTKGEEKGNG